MATCPECDAEVELDEIDADIGDEVSCPECGESLVVSGTNPLELDFADEEEEAPDKVKDDADLDDEDDGGRGDGDLEE